MVKHSDFPNKLNTLEHVHESMNTDCPYMESFVRGNPDLFQLLLENTDYKFFNDKYEQLFMQIYKNDAEGVEEKIQDVQTIRKFYALIAELKVGNFFSTAGCKIKFISDTQFTGKSPDIELHYNGKKYFVEVFSRNDYSLSIELMRRLRPFLVSKPYCVDIDILDEEHAVPRFTRDKVAIMQCTANSIMDEFKSLFIETETEYFVDIGGVRFTVTPISRTDGYPGIAMGNVYEVPTGEIKKVMADVIIDKAIKSRGFNQYFKGVPYLLTCSDSSYILDRMDYEALLFGTSCHIGAYPRDPSIQERSFRREVERIQLTSEWERILAAKKDGWDGYLQKVKLLPTDYCFLLEYGQYLSASELDDVSGLFVFHKESDNYFLPNPFAQEHANLINDSLCNILLNKTESSSGRQS